jgi:hypothetical protein
MVSIDWVCQLRWANKKAETIKNRPGLFCEPSYLIYAIAKPARVQA